MLRRCQGNFKLQMCLPIQSRGDTVSTVLDIHAKSVSVRRSNLLQNICPAETPAGFAVHMQCRQTEMGAGACLCSLHGQCGRCL